MIILGVTADDKGAQLEALVKTTLEGQGFIEVRRNRIDAGGNELDVAAEMRSPVGASLHVTPLLCEAKAYKSPVGMPEWQKFLGKLLLSRLKNVSTIGILVALNGVNGNVHGSFRALQEQDHSTYIIEGRELQARAVESGEILSEAEAVGAISELFSRVPSSIEAAYYGGGFFWVVRWDDGEEYSVAHGQGAFLSESQLSQLRPALAETLSGRLLETAEAEARAEAAHRARVSAITGLLRGREESRAEVGDLDEGTLPSLAAEPFLRLDGDRLTLLPAEDLDSAAVARLFNCMFERTVSVAQLTFMVDMAHLPYVNRLIDLIPEFQAGFQPDEDSVMRLRAIAPYFPSLWMRLLTPITMITTHRSAEEQESGDVADLIAASDQMAFWEEVVAVVRSDFSNVFLRGLLYDYLGIAEIEQRTEVVIKSKTGVVGDLNMVIRDAIGQLDEELVGEAGTKHILVRVLPTMDQPWERGHPAPVSAPDGAEVREVPAE